MRGVPGSGKERCNLHREETEEREGKLAFFLQFQREK